MCTSVLKQLDAEDYWPEYNCSFQWSTPGLVPLEWGCLMLLFVVERVYLSRIRLSLVSGPCEYVAPIHRSSPICISVVGRHGLVESSLHVS
jgi:hypothetical protein